MNLELDKKQLALFREASKEMAAAQAVYLEAEAAVFGKVAKAIGYDAAEQADDVVRENLWKIDRAGKALLFDDADDWNLAFQEVALAQFIEWAEEDLNAAREKLSASRTGQ